MSCFAAAPPLSASLAEAPPVCILHIVPPSASVPFAPPPACLRCVPFSRVSHGRACVRVCAGAVRAPSVMGRSPSSRFFQRRKSRSDFRHANREVDRPSMFAAGLSHSGEAWLLLSVRITRLSGTHPIRVRRQALASVRGQRHGCQHHAWSKRVPRADLNSVLDRATAVRRTRRASCIIGTRVPARDTGRSSPSGALFPPPAVDCPWEARAPKPCEAPSPPRA